MQLGCYEIFDLFQKAKNRQEKIQVLRKHNCKMLQEVLHGTFDRGIEFFTRDFPREYKPDFDAPVGMSHSHLGMEMRKMYMFRDNYTKLSYEQKTKLFTQLLESLEPREAEVVLWMFRKHIPIEGLTVEPIAGSFWMNVFDKDGNVIGTVSQMDDPEYSNYWQYEHILANVGCDLFDTETQAIKCLEEEHKEWLEEKVREFEEIRRFL